MTFRVIMRNLSFRGAAPSALIKGEESQGHQSIFTAAAGHLYGSNWALEYQLRPNVSGCGFPQKIQGESQGVGVNKVRPEQMGLKIPEVRGSSREELPHV